MFFVIKENHAFENYFGTLPGVMGFPPSGALPVSYGSSAVVHPFALPGFSTPDLPHDRNSSVADLDGGRMDGFVAQARAAGAAAPADAVGYYTARQIPAYFAYARYYGIEDDFFAGVLGPTLPNRLFDLGLTSVNWTSDAFPPSGDITGTTLPGQLSQFGLPWSYYYTGFPFGLAPQAVPSIADNPCLAGNVTGISVLAHRLTEATAPAVAWVDPSTDPLYSEHPPENVTLGSEWTVAFANAIFRSPIGNSSVIFVLFDEAGGFWDPIVPPTRGPIGDGFRVPLLVLSPWTPPGLVISVPSDPASLLRFVDDNWGLPYLNARVAGAPSLTSFFDFNASPRAPLILSTVLDSPWTSVSLPLTAASAPARSVGPLPPPGWTCAVSNGAAALARQVERNPPSTRRARTAVLDATVGLGETQRRKPDLRSAA